MILAQLQNFQWYNDPENVTFTALGMQTESKPETDFWQNAAANIHKDDGHFFYAPKSENFTLTLCWNLEKYGEFNQCGIMIRIDEYNWLKASIMYEDLNKPAVASCATINGFSDWATHNLQKTPSKLFYRIKRINNDYVVYISEDGENFEQIRLVHIANNSNRPILAGAFICSPKLTEFAATLTSLDFE